MWSGSSFLCRPTTISFFKCSMKPIRQTRNYILGSQTLVVKTDPFLLSGNRECRALYSNQSRLCVLRLSSPSTPEVRSRYFTNGPATGNSSEEENQPAKPSLYQRFKAMYKDYWYVLIPVHVVTSCMWFGAFFYTAQSGFDIAGAIEFLNLSEETMDKVRHSANSTAGHLTLAYLLYKIFTPLRYTVTLGGTTYSIKFLTARGLLKKMPKREELKQMYAERKDMLKEQKDNFKKEMVGKFSSSKKTICDDATLHDLKLKPLGGAGMNQPLLVLKTPIPALASRPIQRGLQDGKPLTDDRKTE
uniref:Protein FAM210A n=1 Tax=Lygus hesperus TaxID=30085 RepID=A0A146LGA8_LYGHE